MDLLPRRARVLVHGFLLIAFFVGNCILIFAYTHNTHTHRLPSYMPTDKFVWKCVFVCGDTHTHMHTHSHTHRLHKYLHMDKFAWICVFVCVCKLMHARNKSTCAFVCSSNACLQVFMILCFVYACVLPRRARGRIHGFLLIAFFVETAFPFWHTHTQHTHTPSA
jgi:hypothetical protein